MFLLIWARFIFSALWSCLRCVDYSQFLFQDLLNDHNYWLLSNLLIIDVVVCIWLLADFNAVALWVTTWTEVCLLKLEVVSSLHLHFPNWSSYRFQLWIFSLSVSMTGDWAIQRFGTSKIASKASSINCHELSMVSLNLYFLSRSLSWAFLGRKRKDIYFSQILLLYSNSPWHLTFCEFSR